MPWKDTNPVDQRHRFIAAMTEGTFHSFNALCQHFNISRNTGYRWKKRFLDLGWQGLQPRSSAPLNHGRRLPPEIVQLVVSQRKKHKTWGPKKIKASLEALYPELTIPATSSIGMILKRKGLVHSKKKRIRLFASDSPLSHAKGPNDVWSIDFKGQFRMGNRSYCYPLTVCDAHSRFLLACDGFRGPSHQPTQQALEQLFIRFGLPSSIRSDNGVPFCFPTAPAGISRLAVWLLDLNIPIKRIEPGKPQQNGRHERMHRTLKAETTKPPGRNLAAQQELFDKFREEYNFERPHEALEFRTPASSYEDSTRPYRYVKHDEIYPETAVIRKVKRGGSIKIFGGEIYISVVLKGRTVGVLKKGGDLFEVYYREIFLGEISRSQLKFRGVSVKVKRKTHEKIEGQSQPQARSKKGAP